RRARQGASMTTDLLPFDLETALREPERVRHSKNPVARVSAAAHFPEADRGSRVAVLWLGAPQPGFYGDDGYDIQRDECVLRLAHKTRKVWVRVCKEDGQLKACAEPDPSQFGDTASWGRPWLDLAPTEIEIREDA